MLEERSEDSRIEWSTKNLAATIVNTSWADGKDRKSLIKDINSWSRLPRSKDDSKDKEASEDAGPAVGSFERFMSGFKVPRQDALQALEQPGLPNEEG